MRLQKRRSTTHEQRVAAARNLAKRAVVSLAQRKAAALRDLGCDAVVNYKQEDCAAAFKRICPDGFDVVLEGVGGRMLAAALGALDAALATEATPVRYASTHETDRAAVSSYTILCASRRLFAGVPYSAVCHRRPCAHAVHRWHGTRPSSHTKHISGHTRSHPEADVITVRQARKLLAA